MKKNKFTLLIYILLFLVTIIMSICLTFLYFKKVKNNDIEVTYKYVNLLTTFQNGNKISLNNMKKGLEKSYSFSVTNSNKDTPVDYKITLKVITPFSNIVDNNFVYTLESNTDNIDKNNKLISMNESFVPIYTTDIGNGSITPNTTHNYILTIKYNDVKDIIDFKDKIFVSEILVQNIEKGN